MFHSKLLKMQNAGCLPAVGMAALLYFIAFWLDAYGHQILRVAQEMRAGRGY